MSDVVRDGDFCVSDDEEDDDVGVGRRSRSNAHATLRGAAILVSRSAALKSREASSEPRRQASSDTKRRRHKPQENGVQLCRNERAADSSRKGQDFRPQVRLVGNDRDDRPSRRVEIKQMDDSQSDRKIDLRDNRDARVTDRRERSRDRSQRDNRTGEQRGSERTNPRETAIHHQTGPQECRGSSDPRPRASDASTTHDQQSDRPGGDRDRHRADRERRGHTDDQSRKADHARSRDRDEDKGQTHRSRENRQDDRRGSTCEQERSRQRDRPRSREKPQDADRQGAVREQERSRQKDRPRSPSHYLDRSRQVEQPPRSRDRDRDRIRSKDRKPSSTQPHGRGDRDGGGGDRDRKPSSTQPHSQGDRDGGGRDRDRTADKGPTRHASRSRDRREARKPGDRRDNARSRSRSRKAGGTRHGDRRARSRSRSRGREPEHIRAPREAWEAARDEADRLSKLMDKLVKRAESLRNVAVESIQKADWKEASAATVMEDVRLKHEEAAALGAKASELEREAQEKTRVANKLEAEATLALEACQAAQDRCKDALRPRPDVPPNPYLR